MKMMELATLQLTAMRPIKVFVTGRPVVDLRRHLCAPCGYSQARSKAEWKLRPVCSVVWACGRGQGTTYIATAPLSAPKAEIDKTSLLAHGHRSHTKELEMPSSHFSSDSQIP